MLECIISIVVKLGFDKRSHSTKSRTLGSKFASSNSPIPVLSVTQ